VRRGLLKRLPALTEFYGIRPPDIDDMTYAEVSEYIVQMDQEKRRRDNG
jgi:hypothetical protein